MFTIAMLTAIAVLGFAVGRLAAEPQIRRLDHLLRIARHAADHDRLTGLPNRALAARMFQHQQTQGRPTLVVLVDLNRFKQVNDCFGHATGDHLLSVAAKRLASAASAHGGTAARLGGDEFLLLLPDHSSPTSTVEQILHTLTRPAQLRTSDGLITVEPGASAGIARYDGQHGTLSTLLAHADVALYHAKQQQGACCTYQPEMRIPRTTRRHGPRLRDQHTNGNRPTGDEATS